VGVPQPPADPTGFPGHGPPARSSSLEGGCVEVGRKSPLAGKAGKEREGTAFSELQPEKPSLET